MCDLRGADGQRARRREHGCTPDHDAPSSDDTRPFPNLDIPTLVGPDGEPHLEHRPNKARPQVAVYRPRLAHAFTAPLFPPPSSPHLLCLPERKRRRQTRPTALSRRLLVRRARAPGPRHRLRKVRRQQWPRPLPPKRRLRRERRREEELHRMTRKTTHRTARRPK